MQDILHIEEIIHLIFKYIMKSYMEPGHWQKVNTCFLFNISYTALDYKFHNLQDFVISSF